MKSLSQKLRSQEALKEFWIPGDPWPAGSFLEPEINLNTYILYKVLLLEYDLVFEIKCFVFSSKNMFALYLNDPAKFVSMLCPPGWRYFKNSNSHICDRGMGFKHPFHPPPQPLRVNIYFFNVLIKLPKSKICIK